MKVLFVSSEMASAISRSYFEQGGWPAGPIAAMLPISLSFNMIPPRESSPIRDAPAFACASCRSDACGEFPGHAMRPEPNVAAASAGLPVRSCSAARLLVDKLFRD